MSTEWAFRCLELAPDADARTIRRRYSELLKINRPEDNPLGFQQLRNAYEICLAFARAAEQQPQSVFDPTDTIAVAPSRTNAARDDAGSEPGAPEVRPADTFTTVQADAYVDDAEPTPRHSSTFVEVDMSAHPEIVPPARTPAEVIDELIQVDARGGAGAVAGWLVQCPEVLNLVMRDAVELALLMRIAGGAAFGAASLMLLRDTFGWQQLGFERRLLHLGVARDALEKLSEGAGRALADAEFQVHLASGKALSSQGPWHYDPVEQARQLRRLHERRDVTPRLYQALWPGRSHETYRLIQLYAQRYGTSAARQVFGRTAIKFWSNLQPENGMSWRQYRLRLVQVTFFVWLFFLILPGRQLFSSPDSMQDKWNTLQQWSAIWLLYVWPLLVAVITIYALLRSIGTNRDRLEHYRLRSLRVLLPWLAPQRALPLLLVLAPLLIASGCYISAIIPFVLALLLCGLFGAAGLSIGVVGSFAVGCAVFTLWPWPDTGTFFPAMTWVCVLIAWLVDCIGSTGAVRRQAQEDELQQALSSR